MPAEPRSPIELRRVTADGVASTAWVGGSGEALLLIHGGWAGAEVHWSRVLPALSTQFRVIAPDLPGFEGVEPGGISSLSDFAGWLAKALDALGVDRAWVAGNSFGASVAWRFAELFPARTLGVVLVNGGPAGVLPGLLLLALRVRPINRMLRWSWRRTVFSPSVVQRAFARPERTPERLLSALANTPAGHVERLWKTFDEAPSPVRPLAVPVLVLWGEEDHLAGANAAETTQRAVQAAELVKIPDAGHLPQVEQPDAFVRVVTAFARFRRSVRTA